MAPAATAWTLERADSAPPFSRLEGHEATQIRDAPRVLRLSLYAGTRLFGIAACDPIPPRTPAEGRPSGLDRCLRQQCGQEDCPNRRQTPAIRAWLECR